MALTKKQRAIVREKFGGRCAYCGCELPERWHADHVIPVVRKLKVNMARQWPEPKDGEPRLHIKAALEHRV